MFDELDKQNSQNTIPPTPLNPPNPLYQGGTFRGEANALAKTEDIFAKIDKVTRPTALMPRPNDPLLPRPTVIPEDDSWLKNKSLILGLAIGGLVIVLGGGYLGLKMMMKKTPLANTNKAVESDLGNAPSAPEAPAPTPEAPTPTPAPEANNNIVEPVPSEASQPIDSDQDGLTDEEEVSFGTNANSPDTDQDSLTDREEVKVYGTDPLKADTDGDGYIDGDEIKNGFNPKGPGKLLDINTQK